MATTGMSSTFCVDVTPRPSSATWRYWIPPFAVVTARASAVPFARSHPSGSKVKALYVTRDRTVPVERSIARRFARRIPAVFAVSSAVVETRTAELSLAQTIASFTRVKRSVVLKMAGPRLRLIPSRTRSSKPWGPESHTATYLPSGLVFAWIRPSTAGIS